jgi:hypothetical protein
MNRLWVLFVLFGFLLAVSCQDANELTSPESAVNPAILASHAIVVHDYTNVSMDPGHYLLPDGYAGATVVAYTGPIGLGRGGSASCPYDDTYRSGQVTPTPEGHAEAFDRLWFQIISFSASITYDLGARYNQVYISLNQDHGPYPAEALEYRVAVSNNAAGPFSTLPVNTPITMYAGGWSTAGEYAGDCNGNGVLNDDYSALWQLPGAYRYVRLSPIANTGSYNEPEIDAIAGVGANYPFDIHPQSCPNPLNPNSKGVFPVALLGTAVWDVHDIDVSTIILEGVQPIKSSFEDVATPITDGDVCDCTEEGPDGFDDLTLKFKTQDIVAAVEPFQPGDVIEMTISGYLLDGTYFEATDCVKIVGKREKEVLDLEIELE